MDKIIGAFVIIFLFSCGVGTQTLSGNGDQGKSSIQPTATLNNIEPYFKNLYLLHGSEDDLINRKKTEGFLLINSTKAGTGLLISTEKKPNTKTGIVYAQFLFKVDSNQQKIVFQTNSLGGHNFDFVYPDNNPEYFEMWEGIHYEMPNYSGQKIVYSDRIFGRSLVAFEDDKQFAVIATLKQSFIGSIVDKKTLDAHLIIGINFISSKDTIEFSCFDKSVGSLIMDSNGSMSLHYANAVLKSVEFRNIESQKLTRSSALN